MSLRQFIDQAVSPWMQGDGPDGDIVLSSRIRLARNLDDYAFPIMATVDQAKKAMEYIKDHLNGASYHGLGKFEWVEMSRLKPIEKRVLVEKHLISPNLAEDSNYSAA